MTQIMFSSSKVYVVHTQWHLLCFFLPLMMQKNFFLFCFCNRQLCPSPYSRVRQACLEAMYHNSSGWKLDAQGCVFGCRPRLATPNCGGPWSLAMARCGGQPPNVQHIFRTSVQKKRMTGIWCVLSTAKYWEFFYVCSVRCNLILCKTCIYCMLCSSLWSAQL